MKIFWSFIKSNVYIILNLRKVKHILKRVDEVHLITEIRFKLLRKMMVNVILTVFKNFHAIKYSIPLILK